VEGHLPRKIGRAGKKEQEIGNRKYLFYHLLSPALYLMFSFSLFLFSYEE